MGSGMAELTAKVRLQPSLLDRLTDDDPTAEKESRDKRVLSLQRLRDGVLRDLGWLLNTTSMSVLQDLEDYPEVRQSVINYGMPGLSGTTVASLDKQAVERMVKGALIAFEPRISSKSIKVRVVTDEEQMSINALTFYIEGELWAQPLPLRLYLRTEVDLDTHDVKVREV